MKLFPYQFTNVAAMGGGAAAPSSTLVSGAGTAAANGTYTYRGTENSKPYYDLLGEPDNPNQSAISWDSTQWIIKLDNSDNGYTSADAVAFPWLAIFTTADGTPPEPTVTQG